MVSTSDAVADAGRGSARRETVVVRSGAPERRQKKKRSSNGPVEWLVDLRNLWRWTGGGDVLAPVSGRRCFTARSALTYVNDRFRKMGCGAGRGGSVSVADGSEAGDD